MKLPISKWEADKRCRDRYCGPKCFGKISYPSRAAAKAALKEMRAKGNLKRDVRPFKCSICEFHHLGSVPKKNTRQVARALREAKYGEAA